jgi:hypothetical protein
MKFTLLSSAISTDTSTLHEHRWRRSRHSRVGRAADNSLALNLGRKGAVIERNTPLACKVISPWLWPTGDRCELVNRPSQMRARAESSRISYINS